METLECVEKVQRTTVRVPRSLYREAQYFAETTSSKSINDFFVAALAMYVKILKRKQIDAAFSHMAEDADYQKEARLVTEEFTDSDREALEFAERELDW